MYTCKDSIEKLLEFLDGEVPEDVESHLQEHLAGCPPCVDFLRTYRATPDLCRKALVQKMPTEMASRLTDFLRQHCKKK